MASSTLSVLSRASLVCRSVRQVGQVVAFVTAAVASAAMPAAAQHAASPLQGFSIVLVQGDMAAGGGRSDLPDAAARAVGDMKGLLPFRSYRLVDSAWVLADTPSGLINARLQGPDGVDYDVVLEALPATGGGQRVAFRLRESGGEVSSEARAMERDLATLNTIVASLREKHEAAVRSQHEQGGSGATTEFLLTQLADAERRVAILKTGMAAAAAARGGREAHTLARADALHRLVEESSLRSSQLEERLAAMTDKYHSSHPDVLALRRQRDEARRRIAQLLADAHALGQPPAVGPSTTPAGATLIETMFTMRLGETVVVGTSRTGVDKALVAVLTAVPQSKGRGGF